MNYNFLWTEDSIKRNNLSFKYEPIQPLILLELLRRSKVTTFFDIGANVGLYSIVMTLSSDIKNIFSFEANAKALQELNVNVELNQLQDIIFTHCKAVSNKCDVVDFQIESDFSGINSIVSTSFHKKVLFCKLVQVETISLDSFLEKKHEKLAFKIDVEGHECEVINGAETLLRHNNCILQIEILNSNYEKCSSMLSALGYREIFNVKDDHYFVNFEIEDGWMLSALKTASSHLVDMLLGKWPTVRTKNPLSVNYNYIDGKVKVEANWDEKFFKHPEFCFYLYCDNKKINSTSYVENNFAIFDLPKDNTNKMTATAFVRDKFCITKKIKKSVELKSE